MSGKVISAAILAAVVAAAPAFGDLRGPAELPPPGYNGQQYVDSRGCVFLRAGYSGKQAWVPRVSRDRKQLCGYPPSGRPVATAEESAPAPTAAPAPAKVAAAPAAPAAPKPVAKAAVPKAAAAAPAKTVTVAPGPLVTAPAAPAYNPPATSAATASAYKTAPATTVRNDGMRLACPADVPVAERFEMQGGGSKVLCTKGDGTLNGATLPRLVAGSTSGYPTGYDAWSAPATGSAAKTSKGTSFAATPAPAPVPRAAAAAEDRIPTPPPGYKLAWEDDRLNPNRGKQTVQGVVDQDQVWTRNTPAELRVPGEAKPPLKVVIRHKDGSTSERSGIVVSTKGDGKRVIKLLPEDGVSKSTKTDPKVAAATGKSAAAAKEKSGGRIFVQVGSFGVPANAEGTAGRLSAMGLPVSRGKAGGLQVVYAGPFDSAAAAKSALAAVRGAGFGDAMIVQ